jgi:hypothetical protein
MYLIYIYIYIYIYQQAASLQFVWRMRTSRYTSVCRYSSRLTSTRMQQALPRATRGRLAGGDMSVCVCVCVRMCVYVCMRVSVYACMYDRMRTCVSVCVCDSYVRIQQRPPRCPRAASWSSCRDTHFRPSARYTGPHFSPR